MDVPEIRPGVYVTRRDVPPAPQIAKDSARNWQIGAFGSAITTAVVCYSSRIDALRALDYRFDLLSLFFWIFGAFVVTVTFLAIADFKEGAPNALAGCCASIVVGSVAGYWEKHDAYGISNNLNLWGGALVAAGVFALWVVLIRSGAPSRQKP